MTASHDSSNHTRTQLETFLGYGQSQTKKTTHAEETYWWRFCEASDTRVLVVPDHNEMATFHAMIALFSGFGHGHHSASTMR